jgi:hypothetical protein
MAYMLLHRLFNENKYYNPFSNDQIVGYLINQTLIECAINFFFSVQIKTSARDERFYFSYGGKICELDGDCVNRGTRKHLRHFLIHRQKEQNTLEDSTQACFFSL